MIYATIWTAAALVWAGIVASERWPWLTHSGWAGDAALTFLCADALLVIALWVAALRGRVAPRTSGTASTLSALAFAIGNLFLLR